MATVKLVWQKFPTTDGDEIHRSEVKARNGKDALFMEVHARRRALIRQHIVTAYYWLEDNQRGIRLYDDDGFRGPDDAREALTQWYLDNAATLLVTLAG